MAHMSHKKFDAFDYSKFVCMECHSRISDPVLPWTQLRRNDVKQKFNRIGLELPADIERRRELTRSYMKNTLSIILRGNADVITIVKDLSSTVLKERLT